MRASSADDHRTGTGLSVVTGRPFAVEAEDARTASGTGAAGLSRIATARSLLAGAGAAACGNHTGQTETTIATGGTDVVLLLALGQPVTDTVVAMTRAAGGPSRTRGSVGATGISAATSGAATAATTSRGRAADVAEFPVRQTARAVAAGVCIGITGDTCRDTGLRGTDESATLGRNTGRATAALIPELAGLSRFDATGGLSCVSRGARLGRAAEAAGDSGRVQLADTLLSITAVL